ncbi:hypothetical protein GCK32_013332 [Trichostrongylus colubriformis]|uniref:Uncharacterized protein n=1 Tax=Trichostrongylus colubriformis TaxID=6319 RepID=A0AAN8IT87_TRICO
MTSQQLLFLAVVSFAICIESSALMDRSLATPLEPQEGFPGHVALRPDYTFWNIVKMLRNFMDSNEARQVRSENLSGPRELRSLRPKFFYST